jgi:hypothetical protein
MGTLTLRETTDSVAWDARLARSPQATVFSSTRFLQAAGLPFRLFEVQDGARTVALLPVTEDASGQHATPPAYTPYLGPLCLHEPGLANRQRVLDEFRVGELVAAELAQRWRSVRMPLSWQFADVRPFLWHNYHAAGAPRYTATPRYTAVLPLAGLSAESFPPRVRACRRQEWRKAAASELRDDIAVDDFLRLYALTFERQGLAVDEPALATVRRITEAALAGGWGRLAGIFTGAGLSSATLFVFDHARAYYLFGASDPAARNSGAATRLIFDNVFDAIARGLAEVDFVGVNSPARGDFKLSFDPELRPYFELSHVAA